MKRKSGREGTVGFFSRWVFLGVSVLIGVALWPLAVRQMERDTDRRLLAVARDAAAHLPFTEGAAVSSLDGGEDTMRLEYVAGFGPIWGDVGGCGAGGGVASGGSIKWIGRGVTGGLVDVQVTGTQVFYTDLDSRTADAKQTAFATRLGTTLDYKWDLALTVPFLYNYEPNVWVTALSDDRSASLAGFGDLSFDVTRKLGIANASSLTLTVTAPTGVHDAIRQGEVMPLRSQLGPGVPTATLSFEHTFDTTWGLIIAGSSVSSGSWGQEITIETSLPNYPSGGDLRGASVSGWSHFGFIVGPFMPSVGVTVVGKIQKDVERGEAMNQPWVMVPLSASLEWSSDYVAILATAQAPLNIHSKIFDNWMVGLGVKTSVF